MLPSCTSWRSYILQNTQPADESEFRAPERTRRAYALLRDTQRSASSHVGAGGGPSDQVVAFQVLLNSRQADRGFKLLLENATLEGQLYGLSGLYFTDREEFGRQVERYAQLEEDVQVLFGCSAGSEPAASIVFAERGVLPEKLEAWHRDKPLEEFPPVDIAHGGWPDEFRIAFSY
ncbi:MAG: hypothetical protein MPN21_22975 [Thermoanaerobaculia bacterium]|nr:hypothetical protein [Thermoanaerobaculia bacterium]